jgi:putative tryptophan/tyrosine transport system substrate-binding protein
MDRRRFLLTSLAGALATPLAAGAQQPGNVYRIGVLGAPRPPEVQPLLEAFRLGLRDQGWTENENFVFVRSETDAKPERYPRAAAELVALRPDVIVTALGDLAIEALKNATRTIPIVMQVSADPVGSGLVNSLARPGGNITGMSILAPEVSGKRLEILKEAVSHSTRVAVLWNAADPSKAAELRNTQAAAVRLKILVHSVEVRGVSDFPRAFSTITRTRADALLTLAEPLTILNAQEIVRYATAHRLPLVSEVRQFADAGALMTYGANLADLLRRSAGHVDKILRGVNPSDIPIEQPTRFEFVINLKTAKALGLTIPPSLLARADQVIA